VNTWIEVKATFAERPEDWSVFADAFDRHGCPGSLQTDSPPSISAYLLEIAGSDERVTAMKAELTRLGASTVDTKLVPEEDWAEDWKQHFKPRRIGERIVIRPTWEGYNLHPNDIEIVLDPGQAFGTGDHPTTRLCLQLMQQIEIKGKSAADVGCGSGILSIAACLLGAGQVYASDLDAQSVEVTKANAALNKVSFQAEVAPGFDGLKGMPREVVLSNIISATLIRLAPDAATSVARGGHWIVSGIIESNWPDVRSAAERGGFTLQMMEQEDEWVAAIFLR